MSAWLARIELNTRSPEVRRDLGNVELLHKRMMLLVPDDLGTDPRALAGLLFRLEQSAYAATLLVQSRLEMTPGRLPEGYGRIQMRDLTPMLEALTKGRAVQYRIAGNASKRKAVGSKSDTDTTRRGPIVALHGQAAEDWWRDRARTAGLCLHSLVSSPDAAARGGKIRHDLTRFDGTASIEDPQALTEALLNGIGRGKSYGAGLLSLAPARLD